MPYRYDQESFYIHASLEGIPQRSNCGPTNIQLTSNPFTRKAIGDKLSFNDHVVPNKANIAIQQLNDNNFR